MRQLTLEEVKDILTGCTILGTGGGGDLQRGLRMAEEDFGGGLKYTLLSLDEVEDEALYACPYFCGSIDPSRGTGRYYDYPRVETLETVLAVEALERFVGERLAGMVSIEYGGMNTAVAMSTGARLNKPFVDADAAGRAVPDLQLSTFNIVGKVIHPLTVANGIGEVAVFEKVIDDFRAEDLVRALAVASGNSVGVVDHPIRGNELKKSVIPGALTYAGQVGRAQRLAVAQGRDPVAQILDAADGYILFQGIVREDSQWRNEGGFTLGTTELTGVGKSQGDCCKIWFKNENIICWVNDLVAATVPDLICTVASDTGYPVTNPFCKQGMGLTVLGFKASDIWRTKQGLSLLTPGCFGFDIDYVPIEKIVDGKAENA